MFTLFKTWVDWGMSRQMINGTITTQLLRPLDYQLHVLFESLGDVISNLTTIFLPSLIVIIVVFGASIPLGLNIVVFALSLVLAYLISFCFDFSIGLTSFYTESIWGISITKEVIIMLLSGALIPLPFFPDTLRTVVQYLPFQAIYNIPLSILTKSTLGFWDYINMLGIQIMWLIILVVLNRLYFRQASKVITVNGG
jgi:ABC-2 type transport system permease protein